MKLWTVSFDENQKNNFPQIIYKGFKTISADEQAKLTPKIYKIIQLTNRDKLQYINDIIKNSNELPFKALYKLIFEKELNNLEFQTEYLVEFLNLFQIELS